MHQLFLHRGPIHFARSGMMSLLAELASLLAGLSSIAQHAVDRTQFGTVPEIVQVGQLFPWPTA